MEIPTNEEHKKLLKLLGNNGYNKKVPWSYISSNYKLSIEVLREFKHELDWGMICYNNNESLDIKSLLEFKDYVNWNYISSYRILTINELDIFKNYLNWQLISKFQPLPFEALDGRFDKYLIKSSLKLNSSKQSIKNRDWFIGYTIEDCFSKNKLYYYEYTAIMPRYFYNNYYKVLIFYKDLIKPGKAVMVYPIKKFYNNCYSYKRGEAVKSLYIERINKIINGGKIK